jgi:hypothetical protein
MCFFSKCDSTNLKSLCSKFSYKIKETDTGLQIDVAPKDASKTDSLKSLAKVCKDFCDCC